MDTSQPVKRSCKDCEWFLPYPTPKSVTSILEGKCNVPTPVWTISNVPIMTDDLNDAQECKTFKQIET